MIEHHILKAVGRPPADREDVHDDLCARLAPLDRYGLADFASVLVDGVLALTKMLAIVASKALPGR